MKKAYKYRLMGNKYMFAKVEQWLGLCCRLYNTALEQRIVAYKDNRKRISCYTQQRQLKELKFAFSEYEKINAQVLQDVLARLDRAYEAFFRRLGNNENKVGFPRFKSQNRYDSFTLKQNGWKLEGRTLIIFRVGRFKLRLSRPIEGNIKTIAIHRSGTNKWYACFNCDNVPERKLQKANKEIGIDVGVKSFCVDSEGNRIENPLYLRQSEAILRRKQRRQDRRRLRSNRWKKAKLQVSKAHEKIKNQRLDFLHKVANYYIESYDKIYVENLIVQNMVRNKYLAKSISDSSWSKFFEIMSYKAVEAGREIIKVSPHNTSQICFKCGEKVEKTLKTRVHRCPYCGLVMDRDENAARNILQVGQTCQVLTKEDALCVA